MQINFGMFHSKAPERILLGKFTVETINTPAGSGFKVRAETHNKTFSIIQSKKFCVIINEEGNNASATIYSSKFSDSADDYREFSKLTGILSDLSGESVSLSVSEYMRALTCHFSKELEEYKLKLRINSVDTRKDMEEYLGKLIEPDNIKKVIARISTLISKITEKEEELENIRITFGNAKKIDELEHKIRDLQCKVGMMYNQLEHLDRSLHIMKGVSVSVLEDDKATVFSKLEAILSNGESNGSLFENVVSDSCQRIVYESNKKTILVSDYNKWLDAKGIQTVAFLTTLEPADAKIYAETISLNIDALDLKDETSKLYLERFRNEVITARNNKQLDDYSFVTLKGSVEQYLLARMTGFRVSDLPYTNKNITENKEFKKEEITEEDIENLPHAVTDSTPIKEKKKKQAVLN